VTKVAGTMKVEIDVQDNVKAEVLEAVFRRGIADALKISIEHVAKLNVVEIGQGSGSRRLQSTQVKQYEVSYEVISPSSVDPAVVVEKANRITEASTVESQVFRQVLSAQDGVSQVKQVVPKVVAYKFEEEITTPSAVVGPNKNDTSGMSAGLIILIVFLVVLFLVLVALKVVMIKCKTAPEAKYEAQNKDTRQGDLEAGSPDIVREPSHTLLDGDVHDAGKKN